MEYFTVFFNNLIILSAEASPWLLLGLFIAGLMKSLVPTQILSNHLGEGKLAIVKAAFIGAPLPLCSCGVIPVATELKRSGASSAATSSFLVATPETGVDSVSVSYALLGPVFAIYRPISAILSAIFTGFVVAGIKESPNADDVKTQENNAQSSLESTLKDTSQNNTPCCAPKKEAKNESCCASKEEVATASCCAPKEEVKSSSCCASESSVNVESTLFEKIKTGIHYACTKLIDDIILWLAIGLIFATIVRTFLPESFLLSYGSGLPAMLMMILISIPMYICATASTPIAAGFIMAGLSPGTALVFMMAGPATNISTLGVIKLEMGSAVLIRYLLGIAVSAIGFGLLLDFGLKQFHIDITQQMHHAHDLLPQWFGITCFALIIFLSIKPLRKFVL
ncbi:MAG: SO_0444 family Cu/Zn efflux transporter [Colwellia sp.]